MKSYEFTAKTVEKAIEYGLLELGKKQEDVDIKIINEGGFLKKAKVVINVEEEPKHHFVPTKKPEPKLEPGLEKEVIEAVEEIFEKNEDIKETIEEIVEETAEEVKNEAKEVDEQDVEVTENITEEPKNVDKKPEKKELTPAEKEQAYLEKHVENNTTSLEFVDGLLKLLQVEANVSLEETREESRILIETEQVGKIVGHRGECLSAIQCLANIIEAKDNPNAKRVVVDCGEYKKKHEDSLRALAIKVAGRVSETGRPYKLDPMPAFDRRIIHTELMNYPSVETHSEGIEPRRRIVVTKKK